MSSLAPRGSGRREALLLLLVLTTCPLAAWLIGDDPAGAVARARALIDIEDAAGLHVEPALNAWARDHAALWSVLNAGYLGAHVPVVGWALIWTWHLRRDRFAALRDTLMRLQVSLVVLWVAMPTAPPSAVPGSGMRSTTSAGTTDAVAAVAHTLQSPFAAVPSGHVAFAIVAGALFARHGDQLWLRWFGWAYPAAVLALVILTGNHLWVDGAAGAAAAWVASASAWRRPLPAPRVRRRAARARRGTAVAQAPAD